MAEISSKIVMELRRNTGAGMMACKNALQENDGDMEKSVDYLRKKGLAAVAKRSGKSATEGSVGSYLHMGGKIGVLLEINCETDFVARGDDFKTFMKDVAMHIAASNPRWINSEEIPAKDLDREKDIFMAQMRESGKPEKILGKIVEGKLKKFAEEHCLLNQPFVKDTDKTIEQLRGEFASKIGENVRIRRFARFEVGEGLEKAEDNLADEVAKTVRAAKNKDN